MKRFVLLLTGIALVGLGASPSLAQYDDYGSTAPSFSSPIVMPFDGSAWVSANGADRGLGFHGSYLSTGVLLPLFMDSHQGTYFIDGRGHVSENGGFFSNLGFGRRWQMPGGATMGVSMWYDYDGDRYSSFGHDFNQLGFSFEMLAENWNYRLNSYFPVGTTNYEQDCFVGHTLLLQNGIDRAFRGVDSDFGFRLPYLDFIGGMGYLGGYFYENEGQKGFGGFRSRITLLPLNNMFVNLQINTDHQFKATGIVSATWYLWGGQKAARQGALLTPTFRNDHIVRVHQDPIAAVNPNTGTLYNVVHVDNTATPGGDGTVERPYNTLTLAETNSVVNDMIYVHRGDGTSAGQDMGITLKDNQLFFGEGVLHKIYTQYGISIMCPDEIPTGQRPLLTNDGGTIVTLASNNEVSGFYMREAVTAISGNKINHARIFDNVIEGMEGNGVQITSSSGNFKFIRNTITESTLNAVSLLNTSGQIEVGKNLLQSNGIGASSGFLINNNQGDTRLDFYENIVTLNGAGVTIQASDAARIIATIHDNVAISGNLGNGIVAIADPGAHMKLSIIENPSINNNGVSTGAGTGIRMRADGTVALPTEFTAIISNNQIKDNAGDTADVVTEAAGIRGDFTRNSFTDITIRDNFISGAGVVRGVTLTSDLHGDAIQLNYGITNTALNTLLVENNLITFSTGIGYRLTAENSTHLSVVNRDNTISDSTYSGAWTIVSGTSVVSTVWEDNTIVGNGNPNANVFLEDDGLYFEATDSSRLRAVLSNNIIRNNGDSPFILPPPILPLDNVDEGVEFVSADSAIVVAELYNNRITGSADEAIQIRNFSATSQMWAILTNNLMTDNNRTPDPTFIPPALFIDRFDFLAINDAGMTRVILTDNVAAQGYGLFTTGGTFLYENNGTNLGQFSGNATQVPAGTIPAPPVIIP